MAQIRTEQIIVLLVVALAVATALFVQPGYLTGAAVAGQTVTSAQLLDSRDLSSLIIFYDNYSISYVDHSVRNPNALVQICGSNLLNKYASLYIKVGNNTIHVGALPAQIFSISSGCAVVDIDLSLYTCFYPALLTVGISNSSSMSSPVFFDMFTNSSDNSTFTGYLKGNFEIDPPNETATNITINVRFPIDENNNTYSIDKPLIVGIRNASTLAVFDSAITSLNNPVTLNKPPGGYIITINNIDNPSFFVPEVDIVSPTAGQNILPGSAVTITVNATGNLTQVLVNVSWDSTSQLLNATFNNATGLWEVIFTNTSTLGRYNITAYAYDTNGAIGTDTSYFMIRAAAVPSGGGGLGGRGGGVVREVPLPPPLPPTIEPVMPPVEEVIPPPVVEEEEVAPPPPPVLPPPLPVIEEEEISLKEIICYVTLMSVYALLALLIVCILLYILYKYILKKPVGRWLEWFIWILIIIILALMIFRYFYCNELTLGPLIALIVIILLILGKFLFDKLGKDRKLGQLEQDNELLEQLDKAIEKGSKPLVFPKPKVVKPVKKKIIMPAVIPVPVKTKKPEVKEEPVKKGQSILDQFKQALAPLPKEKPVKKAEKPVKEAPVVPPPKKIKKPVKKGPGFFERIGSVFKPKPKPRSVKIKEKMEDFSSRESSLMKELDEAINKGKRL